MNALRLVSFILLGASLALIACGFGLGYNAAEGADNACADAQDCHDRDNRNAQLNNLSAQFHVGGGALLTLSIVLFIVDRRMPQA